MWAVSDGYNEWLASSVHNWHRIPLWLKQKSSKLAKVCRATLPIYSCKRKKTLISDCIVLTEVTKIGLVMTISFQTPLPNILGLLVFPSIRWCSWRTELWKANLITIYITYNIWLIISQRDTNFYPVLHYTRFTSIQINFDIRRPLLSSSKTFDT